MSEANISEIVVNFFHKKKTKNAFGILSSGFMELGDLMPNTDINYIGVRHEEWAGHMADAYGRITGEPQLCIIPGGPGITNMTTAVAAARINYSPMFILSDGPTTSRDGMGDFQDLRGPDVLGKVAKDSRLVNVPSRVLDNLNSLYNIAVTPLKGPVHLEISRDTLLESTTVPDNFDGRLQMYLNDPETRAIEAAVKIISESQRPIILAGEEIQSEVGHKLLAELADLLDVPVCSVVTRNDVMDNSNRHFLGSIGRLGSENAMKAMQNSDLVVSIGSSMNPYTFVPYYGFKYMRNNLKVIQVSLNPNSIGRSGDLKLGVVCQAEGFMQGLISYLEKNPIQLKKNENLMLGKDPMDLRLKIFKGVHNREVFKSLFEGLVENSTISVDAGSMSMILLKWEKFRNMGSLLTPGNLGEVGFSIPAAIGAKLAKKDKVSYAFLGDGAFSMELSAILTAVEYNIPIKVIVFNNSAWGSEKAYQTEFYEGRYFGANLKNPDLLQLAKSLGAEAIHVKDAKEVTHGLKEINQMENVGVLIIDTEDDFPTPVRSLDAVRRVNRGIYK